MAPNYGVSGMGNNVLTIINYNGIQFTSTIGLHVVVYHNPDGWTAKLLIFCHCFTGIVSPNTNNNSSQKNLSQKAVKGNFSQVNKR